MVNPVVDLCHHLTNYSPKDKRELQRYIRKVKRIEYDEFIHNESLKLKRKEKIMSHFEKLLAKLKADV